MNSNVNTKKSNLPGGSFITSLILEETVSYQSISLSYLIKINDKGNFVSSKRVDFVAPTMSSVLTQSNINLAYINGNKKVKSFYKALATSMMPDINITYFEEYIPLDYVSRAIQNSAIKIAKDLFISAIREASDLAHKNESNQYGLSDRAQVLLPDEFKKIDEFALFDLLDFYDSNTGLQILQSFSEDFSLINADTQEFSTAVTQEEPIPELPEMSWDDINSNKAVDLVNKFLTAESIPQRQAPEALYISRQSTNLSSRILPLGPPPLLYKYVSEQKTER